MGLAAEWGPKALEVGDRCLRLSSKRALTLRCLRRHLHLQGVPISSHLQSVAEEN